MALLVLTAVLAVLATAIGLIRPNADGIDPTGPTDPVPGLASTPEFCRAAGRLLGSIESMAIADSSEPDELEVAYTDIVDQLDEVADVAPNVEVVNQMGETGGLLLPQIELLRQAGWDLDAMDEDGAEELESNQAMTGPELDRLTGEFERYVATACGLDLVEARTGGIARFHDLVNERNHGAGAG